jgi:hypothetical protein
MGTPRLGCAGFGLSELYSAGSVKERRAWISTFKQDNFSRMSSVKKTRTESRIGGG